MAEQSLAFKCRKWRIGGQLQVMQRLAVVGLFQAIHQRAALNRHFSGDVTHQRVTVNATYRHWQRQIQRAIRG